MKTILSSRKIRAILLLLRNAFFFFKDYIALKHGSGHRFQMGLKDLYPCLRDNTVSTNFDRHYIYHVAWATRKLLELKPISHVDISSSLHFSTTISATIPTTFIDFRPAELFLSNLISLPGDITQLHLPDDSVRSLSCMHVVEHIGLGRYGDPLDPNGDLKALKELERITQEGGHLLLVVPVGKQRIQFNAHRIYHPASILRELPLMKLQEYKLIPDSGPGLVDDPDFTISENQQYGCGCFLLQKQYKAV